MTKLVIFHNPRCSKSRQTLALIAEQGRDPEIVEYLKTPPSPPELKHALSLLGMSPQDVLRKGEEEYKALNLKEFNGSSDELIAIMCAHPKLIERPIVIHGEQACLGRPPENVLEIL